MSEDMLQNLYWFALVMVMAWVCRRRRKRIAQLEEKLEATGESLAFFTAEQLVDELKVRCPVVFVCLGRRRRGMLEVNSWLQAPPQAVPTIREGLRNCVEGAEKHGFRA
jgi:hypothetical protein